MRFSIQEVLAASSCALFISGQPVVGSIFLGLGVLGAIMRIALEMQSKQEAAKAVESGATNFGESLASVISAFSESLEENAKSNNK